MTIDKESAMATADRLEEVCGKVGEQAEERAPDTENPYYLSWYRLIFTSPEKPEDKRERLDRAREKG
jgi:hypothetical protein